MKTLYTTAEVADLFRVTPKTIKRWVADGKLKAIRLPGGHLRFSKEAVDKLRKGK